MKHLAQVYALAQKAFEQMKLKPEEWEKFYIGFLEATYKTEYLKQIALKQK